jgi:REP element-mobilizing transposase RayT
MSFTRNLYHIVFSTFKREQTIPIECEKVLYKKIYDESCLLGGHVYRINGMPDHVHLLVDIPTNISVAEFVGVIKQKSSRFLKTHYLFPQWHGWEEGYGCFTCSVDDLDKIIEYIIKQKPHHQTTSFLDEYRNWLMINGVSPDSPYFPR